MDSLLPHLPGIALALTALFTAVVSPGPAILATIGPSMTASRKAGITMALGTASTSCFWGSVAALGLGSLLLKYAAAIIVLKILGAMYLLWLALKSFRSATRASHLKTKPVLVHSSLAKYYLQGVAIHITNPKPVFGWVAAIALGITQNSPPMIYVLLVLGGTLISLIINITYAVSFSTNTVSQFYDRFHHWFEITFGLIFTAAGLKLLASARHN